MRPIKPLLVAASLVAFARADFVPIQLTPGSFNQDVVVENTATLPNPRSTTASMDGGTNNNGNTWYEVGFNAAAPATGVPAAGSTFAHPSLTGYSFQMAPSFSAPNAFLIAPNQVTSASIALSAPSTFGALSFLASGGNTGISINYTIKYADASEQTGTIAVGDWFNGANPAHTANGRVNVSSFGFDNVNNNNPRLYSYDVTLNNTASAVTAVDISFASGTGRMAIFGMSGSPATGGDFAPVAITGYNYDMIVEASAPAPGAMRSFTTASMDGGTNNTGNTWFERGYDPYNPLVGLPPAGSTLVSSSLPDHSYALPASYTGPNAAMVDSNAPVANLTLATPAAFSALSFLSATANGTVTNECVMQYADGTSETNIFLSRDWFENTPFAFVARGRVNLNDRSLNNINANNPRFYEAQFALGNLSSPVTNVVLKWIGGSASSRVVVFAVSGTMGAVMPLFTTQPQTVGAYEGASVDLFFNVAGTEPIQYRWQKGTNGVYANLTDGGSIAGTTTRTLTLGTLALGDSGDYQLVAQNIAGSSTSGVARVTVLSTLNDVTAPGDVITMVGGSTPANEAADKTIENQTSKYLNFGSGPNANAAPFVGPVGILVTPAVGPTRVTGLRVYTANDGVERDPVDYTLEGSFDGGATFNVISSGPLSLPDGRNGGGMDINPVNQILAQVMFANVVTYEQYRLTFNHVKNDAAANSLQVGEIELLGVTAALNPQLKFVMDGGALTVSSTTRGMLQSTGELNGAATVWLDEGVVSSDPGEAHFYFPQDGGNRFFRVVAQ